MPTCGCDITEVVCYRGVVNERVGDHVEKPIVEATDSSSGPA